MQKSVKPKQSSICFRLRDGRRYFYCYVAGKQHGLGFDREAAERKFAELLASKPKTDPCTSSWPVQIAGQVAAPDAPPVMVAQVLREFLTWIKRNRSEGTYDFHRRHLEGGAKSRKSFVPFLEFVGEMTVDEFGENVVMDWIDTYYSHGSDTYKHNLMRSVKQAFRWACSKKSGKLITENPIDELELPSANSREIEITDDQWSVIEAKATQPVLDLLIVLKETGARPQELREAAAKNLQENNGEPRLYFSKPVKKTRGKQKPRKIYLPPRSYDICKSLADRYPKGPLFRNDDKTGWSKNALNMRCGNKRMKLGFRFFPYALRHTFCTSKLRQGVHPAIVAELMGTSLEMVMRVYNQLGLNDQGLYKALTA